MAISTNKDFGILHDLLDTLVNLGVTFEIDKVYFNQAKSIVNIHYVHDGLSYRVSEGGSNES